MRGEAMMPSDFRFPLKQTWPENGTLPLGAFLYTVCKSSRGGYLKSGGQEMKSTNGKMGILKWAMVVGGSLLFGSVVSFIVRAFHMV